MENHLSTPYWDHGALNRLFGLRLVLGSFDQISKKLVIKINLEEVVHNNHKSQMIQRMITSPSVMFNLARKARMDNKTLELNMPCPHQKLFQSFHRQFYLWKTLHFLVLNKNLQSFLQLTLRNQTTIFRHME